MQWLIDIFESNSDQARLITTLIAAFIAVLVIFINQWFNLNQARRGKYIDKIEELYMIVSKLHEMKLNIYKDATNWHDFHPENEGRNANEEQEKIKSAKENLKLKHIEFTASLYKAQMLASLYFPSVNPTLFELMGDFDDFYEIVHKKPINVDPVELDDVFSKLDDCFVSLYKQLELKMNRYKY
jgi:hypothetical protein